MKAKKTFAVSELKSMINQFLLDSKDEHVQSRIDMCNLLETILMTTGNYAGFTYLGNSEMVYSDSGATVGINGDNSIMTYEEQFDNTDSTRVRYF